MRILFVVSGTVRVAATRYRVYQYLPYLKRNNIRYRVFSVTSDLMTRFTISSPEFGEVTKLAYYILLFIEKFFRFLYVILIVPYYDIVFLQRATFPAGLWKFRWFRNNTKIVFDIDDALFLPDTPKQNFIARFKTFIKERELIGTLNLSDSVIVENEYIRDYVSRYCERVYKIPGPIDTERYYVKEKKSASKKNGIILGWIGSPATTVYLHLLDKVIPRIISRFENIKIVLIGAGDYNFSSDVVIKKKWDYNTEVMELQGFDIGLMPMPDDDWTKGKLGCKMLQYMAVGIPSIVSYTSTNAEIIKDGENGLLVKTESEWIDRLSALIEDSVLRDRIGKSGRCAIEELCSVRNNAPKLLEIFRSLAGGR